MLKSDNVLFAVSVVVGKLVVCIKGTSWVVGGALKENRL